MDTLNSEGPKISFREGRKQNSEKIETPDGNQISVIFYEGAYKGAISQDIKDASKNLLGISYDYLAKTVGREVLPAEYGIEFAAAWMAQGAMIAMDVEELERIASVTIDQSSYQMDLDISTTTHEIAHNFEDEERLPMLIEIAYMARKGHFNRIDEIKAMFTDSTLPERYVQGLNEISEMFDCQSSEVLLTDIINKKIEPGTLEDKFREEAEKIVEEMKEEGL